MSDDCMSTCVMWDDVLNDMHWVMRWGWDRRCSEETITDSLKPSKKRWRLNRSQMSGTVQNSKAKWNWIKELSLLRLDQRQGPDKRNQWENQIWKPWYEIRGIGGLWVTTVCTSVGNFSHGTHKSESRYPHTFWHHLKQRFACTFFTECMFVHTYIGTSLTRS